MYSIIKTKLCNQTWSLLFGRACAIGFVVVLVLAAAALMCPLFAALPDIEPSATTNKSTELFFGLFIGVMITAALYLFFIWIVIRDRGQVFLMLLLLCLCVNMVSTNNILMNQMGIYGENLRSLIQNNSMILSYFFSIFFTRYFLEIDDHTPGLRLPLLGLAGILFLLLAWTAFDQNLANIVLPTLGTLVIATVLGAGVSTLRYGVSGSLSHTVAFSFFLIGSLVDPLYKLGFIKDLEDSNNISYFAFSLAALTFAIVIAGQFASRQEEKERALAISNERFALAARGSNEGLFDWNMVSDEVFFSNQFKKILGVLIEDNRKGLLTWLRMVLPSDRMIIFKALRKFRHNTKGSTIIFEYRIVRPDGERRWIHTKTVATRDIHTGNIIRYVGSIGDITSRKHGETELKASETRFRSITEAHPVPVLIAGLRDSQILYASPGAEMMLGLPQGTLTSHFLGRFITKIKEREEIIESMLGGREVNLKEVSITRGDGDVLPAALSARRINYQNNLAMVIGLYDLTEKKQAEAQIAKQHEALQQSEKMAALGGLLAGVAHELNNPLSVVVGQATLLSEGSPEPKVKSRADKIFKAADRCSRIVKSFLALARRKPPERKALDLNTIVNSSLELLNYQFKNSDVTLELNLEPNMPMIIGDGDQLTQVFTNLALNAAQAMQTWSGKRQITISTKTDIKNPNFIVAKITDTGPGIPKEIKTRVFEPFFTTKGNNGGTGVGLALCLNIIETHGGHLLLEDNLGGGAAFIITLPIASEIESQISKDEIKAEFALPPITILIVDDELELAQTLADLLEPEGHSIDMAANGAIALKKLQKRTYDIIISDLRMPVLDGPGLYEELSKSMPQYLNKIVYVTGDTLSPHVQSFLSQTPVPVIEKPYRLADIRDTLSEMLKKNAGSCSIVIDDSNTSEHPPNNNLLAE